MQTSEAQADLGKMSLASIVKSMSPQQQREFVFRTGLADTSKIGKRQLKEIEKDAKLGFLEFLDPAEKAVLRYSWRFWARPNQLVDMDDDSWTDWLALAGRGFGKTRLGAEWVRELVEKNGAIRIGLIGPTAADARDVMVRGDSGILACSPPWLRAEYSPSNRRVTWSNGAMAPIYSAEEAERLRGPQHHYLWCFPAGTMVSMADGSHKPIESVEVGDLVLTRKGARKVLASSMTRRDADLVKIIHNDEFELTCTPDHLLWTDERGWVRADQIQEGEWLSCLSTSLKGRTSLSTCNQPASNISASAGIETGTAISSEAQPAGDCIGSSTKASSGQSLPDGTSTTSMGIARTITSAISWLSRRVSTRASTTSGKRTANGSERPPRMPSSSLGRVASPPGSRVLSAVRSLKAALSFRATPVPADALSGGETLRHSRCPEKSRAPGARLPSLQIEEPKFTAQSDAIPQHATTAASSAPALELSPARTAKQDSPALDQTHVFVGEPAHLRFIKRSAVTSSARPAGRADVYDITVEGEPEFFADGVLVHNCDELCAWKNAQDVWDMAQMGLRLGQKPRTVITTTPKPTPLLKKLLAENGKTTRVVSGSTYDNSDNLAPTFISTIIARYEGTDLGRQEIHAELLLENKNALWNRKVLSDTRVREDEIGPDDMMQIVVAVDPPASSTEKSDECGIVVCGLAPNRHGYVLADLSGTMSPKKWAQTALRAAKDFNADRIIAERNNGGEMVKHTIKSYHEGGLDGSKVQVKTVFASRGKWTRAEPIASLFQQNRAHIIGIQSKLEDQLTSYDPFEGQKSPDRLDAMVWGLTDLMLRSGARFFV